MITIFENYIITTNTDLRYAIIVKHENDIYVNCYKDKNQLSNGFDKISNITDMSRVIKHDPRHVQKEIDDIKDVVSGEVDVLPIDEVELLMNVNKYNL